MNRERRKKLEAIITRLGNISWPELQDIHDDIEEIRDQEQEARDNLPESIQEGDKGQLMQTAIENLDAAMEAISDLINTIEDFDVGYVLGEAMA